MTKPNRWTFRNIAATAVATIQMKHDSAEDAIMTLVNHDSVTPSPKHFEPVTTPDCTSPSDFDYTPATIDFVTPSDDSASTLMNTYSSIVTSILKNF